MEGTLGTRLTIYKIKYIILYSESGTQGKVEGSFPHEGNRLGHVIDDMQFKRLEETDRQEERRHAR